MLNHKFAVSPNLDGVERKEGYFAMYNSGSRPIAQGFESIRDHFELHNLDF